MCALLNALSSSQFGIIEEDAGLILSFSMQIQRLLLDASVILLFMYAGQSRHRQIWLQNMQVRPFPSPVLCIPGNVPTGQKLLI